MRKFLAFILAAALLLPFGAGQAHAEQFNFQNLKPTYDLGDNYSLHLGRKSGGLLHSYNIVGLRKNDFASEGDAMVFTLSRPYHDFGGDGASLGFVYNRPLQKNVMTTLSLTSGPSDGALVGKQDVAVGFYVHIKFE